MASHPKDGGAGASPAPFKGKDMIGIQAFSPKAWLLGEVDAVSVHPDSRVIVRISDKWFFADEVIFKFEENE